LFQWNSEKHHSKQAGSDGAHTYTGEHNRNKHDHLNPGTKTFQKSIHVTKEAKYLCRRFSETKK
jgi:hypothetical protein